MKRIHQSESGRSLLEILLVMAIMAILTVAALKGYEALALRFESKAVSEAITRHVIERRHEAMTSKGYERHLESNIAGPHGVKFDISNDVDARLIEIKTTAADADLIQLLSTSDILQAEAYTIETPTITEIESSIVMKFIQNPQRDFVLTKDFKCPQHAVCEGTDIHCEVGELSEMECSCGEDNYIKEYTNGEFGCCMCPWGASCNGKKFSCEEGYGKLDYGCIECPENATCNDGLIHCEPGYYQIYDTCIACPDGGHCENNQMTCTGGNAFFNGECIECPTNANCDDGTIKCESGYYHRNGNCLPCPANASCVNGVLQCPSGYKEDSFNGGCKQVIECPEGAVDFGTPDKQIPGTECYCSESYIVSGNRCVAPLLAYKYSGFPSDGCPEGYHWLSTEEARNLGRVPRPSRDYFYDKDSYCSGCNQCYMFALKRSGNVCDIFNSEGTLMSFDCNVLAVYSECGLCISDSVEPENVYRTCPEGTVWDGSEGNLALENGHCMCDSSIPNTCGNGYYCNSVTHRCEEKLYDHAPYEPECSPPPPPL